MDIFPLATFNGSRLLSTAIMSLFSVGSEGRGNMEFGSIRERKLFHVCDKFHVEWNHHLPMLFN